ncbi:palmitoyltransferase ZDHHC5-A-like [Rhinoraja longicauda]
MTEKVTDRVCEKLNERVGDCLRKKLSARKSVSQCVSTKIIQVFPNQKPWMNQEICNLLKNKSRLLKCVWLIRNVTIAVPILQSLLLISSVISYILCLQVNPGIISRDPEDISGVLDAPQVTVNGITFTSKWCHICNVYRPPRCRHCYICDVCVQDLDHHCFFLNTCIGKRNYRFFYILLFSLISYFLLMFSFCLIFLMQNSNPIFITKITTSFLAIISLLISMPLFFFFAFHSFLIATGITTFEKVTRMYKDEKNPFDQGCGRNFAVLLFSHEPSRCSLIG